MVLAASCRRRLLAMQQLQLQVAAYYAASVVVHKVVPTTMLLARLQIKHMLQRSLQLPSLVSCRCRCCYCYRRCQLYLSFLANWHWRAIQFLQNKIFSKREEGKRIAAGQETTHE